jgi:hypothetical protein
MGISMEVKKKQILRSPPPNLPQRAKSKEQRAKSKEQRAKSALLGPPKTFGAPFAQNDTINTFVVP